MVCVERARAVWAAGGGVVATPAIPVGATCSTGAAVVAGAAALGGVGEAASVRAAAAPWGGAGAESCEAIAGMVA